MDNRYVFSRGKGSRTFHDFYQHPVELEQVTSNELLGFLVDFNIQTVTFKLPQPRPPGFPPPVGQSPPGVSNTALAFSIFPRNPDTQ